MSEFATSPIQARSRMRFRHILLLSVIAFGCGVGASWWLADRYGWLGSTGSLATATPAAPAPPTSLPSPVVNPLTPSAADAAMVVGGAARAEGVLVAVAARRAIDNGTPLGYLTDQLRVRFGASQPQAVITVLQASQTPVTIQFLRSELTAIENLLATGTREETLWATIKREFSELFVLRKSDSPSPAPTQRMLRAQVFVESGNIGGAISEISAMPGAALPAAQTWLARAKAYDQTQKALDTLERSALSASTAPAALPPPPIMIPE